MVKSLSLQGQISAVRREIALRQDVYPRLVNTRKMKQGDAEYQIGAMECVLKTLLFIERNLTTIEFAIEQRAASKSGGGHP